MAGARCGLAAAFPRGPTLRVTQADTAQAAQLMRAVYGDWSGAAGRGASASHSFAPRPLPRDEAAGGRYLWTDAFGVLNFVTAAARCGEVDDAGGREDALAAALGLVVAVHDALGQPRAEADMMPSGRPPFGGRPRRYRGLRIGKPRAAAESDCGMGLDGMYFHYHDKWLFALARLAAEVGPHTTTGAALASEAVSLVKDTHALWVECNAAGRPLGVRWKVNMDMSPIRGMPPTRPSSDAISGLVAYRAVATVARRAGTSVREEIEEECQDMATIASALHPVVSSDSLGWGLEAWEAQWLPRLSARSEFAESFEVVRRYAAHADAVLTLSAFENATDPRDRRSLPFRAYGSWIGARLSERASLVDTASALARAAAREELHVLAHSPPAFADGHDALASINRVMLATALDPLAFSRHADEPDVL